MKKSALFCIISWKDSYLVVAYSDEIILWQVSLWYLKPSVLILTLNQKRIIASRGPFEPSHRAIAIRGWLSGSADDCPADVLSPQCFISSRCPIIYSIYFIQVSDCAQCMTIATTSELWVSENSLVFWMESSSEHDTMIIVWTCRAELAPLMEHMSLSHIPMYLKR